MSADVRVTYDASALVARVREFEQRGGKLDDLMPAVAEVLVGAVLQKFEDEGPGWPETRRGGTILQDTGRLVASIEAAHGADWAEAFTNVHYGKYHVTGTDRMPARDFTAIDTDQVEAEVADMLLMELAAP